MKRIFWLPLLLAALLAACQGKSSRVTIFSDGQVISRTTSSKSPVAILSAAGVTLGPDDRLLFQGIPQAVNASIQSHGPFSLTVLRAVKVTLVTPAGSHSIHSSAPSVGQALTEAGIDLSQGDKVDPPWGAPLVEGMTITYQPARGLEISVDGTILHSGSAARTVGDALAEAGVSLIGLDYSIPSASSPLPADGKIRVVRVEENVLLTQKSIPYTSTFEGSGDLLLDQQEVLQAGEPGLAVERTRLHLENGVETARTTEPETVVRPPLDKVIGFGTRVSIQSAVVDGTSIT